MGLKRFLLFVIFSLSMFTEDLEDFLEKVTSNNANDFFESIFGIRNNCSNMLYFYILENLKKFRSIPYGMDPRNNFVFNQSMEYLYNNYQKFRHGEENLHSGKSFVIYRFFYDTNYSRIESAYKRNDKDSFNNSLSDLINQILFVEFRDLVKNF